MSLYTICTRAKNTLGEPYTIFCFYCYALCIMIYFAIIMVIVLIRLLSQYAKNENKHTLKIRTGMIKYYWTKRKSLFS